MKARILTQLLLITATCHFCYGQFILNGNFESTPNFQNWTISGDANIWTAGVNGFPAGDGSSVKYAELSTDELLTKRRDLRQERLHLRLQQQSGQLEQPSRLRLLRRDIGRIETELSQREKQTKAK